MGFGHERSLIVLHYPLQPLNFSNFPPQALSAPGHTIRTTRNLHLNILSILLFRLRNRNAVGNCLLRGAVLNVRNVGLY
jgi:hypothetical protein